LHPLTRGSRPRTSTASASTTVRLEGIAPSPLAYQASTRLSCYRRAQARHTRSLKIRRVKWPVITQRPVRPHGGPTLRGESDKARRQRIERCCSVLETKIVPDGDAKRFRVSGRIRTSNSVLRRVVSHPWNEYKQSERLGLHQRPRGSRPRTLLLSYTRFVWLTGIDRRPRGPPLHAPLLIYSQIFVGQTGFAPAHSRSRSARLNYSATVRCVPPEGIEPPP
jgi:hypothetical protein